MFQDGTHSALVPKTLSKTAALASRDPNKFEFQGLPTDSSIRVRRSNTFNGANEKQQATSKATKGETSKRYRVRLHLRKVTFFNSLFKVLFNFPSRYLLTNGTARIFSIGWNVTPIFALYFQRVRLFMRQLRRRIHSSPERPFTFLRFFFQRTRRMRNTVCNCCLTPQFNSSCWFPWCASPCSLAVTKGIPFGFFSSAY